MSCARCGREGHPEDFGPDDATTCPGCSPPGDGMTSEGAEEHLTYGIPRAAIIDYLLWSYGAVFVEELTNRLPYLRSKPPSSGAA